MNRQSKTISLEPWVVQAIQKSVVMTRRSLSVEAEVLLKAVLDRELEPSSRPKRTAGEVLKAAMAWPS